MRALLFYSVVVALIIALIELVSWGVLSAYYAWFFSAPRDVEKLLTVGDIYSKGVADEYHAWNRAPFLYRPFVMYHHRPWVSKDFNILPDTRRPNGKDETPRSLCEYRIWAFGSSSLTAPEVRDEETLPARLEQRLNKTGKRYCVDNYGQVGYVVQQDLNLFNDLLARHPAPDMVLTMNGWNDANVSWDYQTYHSRYHPQFQGAFDLRLLNVSILAGWAHRFLPNTMMLLQKASALFALKTTSIDTFKNAYILRARQFADLTRRAYPERQEVWLSSMQSIVDLAKARGADAVVTQIPVMMAAKKPLVGFEKVYWQARSLTSFALPEIRVRALTEIDRFGFEQIRNNHQMFDPVTFGDWYRGMNRRLETLASGRGAGYVDLQTVLDRPEHAAKALFISHAHWNAEGLDILAEEVFGVVRRRIR